MTSPDPRLTLAKPDLAAAHLEGVVRAARYAPTETLQVVRPVVALRRAADLASEQMDQLLFGERFEALERTGDFLWGQAQRDGYVGYIEAAASVPAAAPPTHWVKALRTFAFAGSSIKARAEGPFSRNCLFAIVAEDGDFLRDDGGRFLWRDHLAPLGSFAADPVCVAMDYIGAPYLWGGRDSLGLDCSGLVQQALYACGLACPRDTDLQMRLGGDVAQADLARGDLVFWPGHIAMMVDADRIIHANAHHMAVAVENLATAITRIGPPTALRRL